MKNVILCSSNPLLVKSLYGILRDDGYKVETIEHPAFAVHMIMQKPYDLIIIDSEPFGLSAEDAADIIKIVSPGMKILFVGSERRHTNGQSVDKPVNLEEFKRAIHCIAV